MGPQPEARPVARLLHALVRAGRAAVVGVTVVLALLGALVGPPSASLIWAPAVGLVAAGVVALVNPDFPATPGSRRAVRIAGLAGLLVVPFSSGLGLLGAAGAVVVVLQLVVGALWMVDWIAGTPVSTGAQAARHDITYLRRVLPDLPDEVLLREWRASAGRLGPDVDPGIRAAAVELRGLLIDELSRRDPAGVQRWLRAGGSDPDPHLPKPGPTA